MSKIRKNQLQEKNLDQARNYLSNQKEGKENQDRVRNRGWITIMKLKWKEYLHS
jgi:hypothetical protein